MSGIETRKKRLAALYEAYNRRDIPTMVAALDPEVEWMDLLNGSPLKGAGAVADYWTDQFAMMATEVTPLAIDVLPDGRLVVTAAQTLKKLDGTLWANQRVTHVITFGENELIRRMDPR